MKVETLIAELERSRTLGEPARLRERIEALDYLEWYERAEAISARLQAINDDLYRDIRRDLQRGAGPGFLLRLVSGSGRDAGGARPSGDDAYDHLDALVGGVLRLEPPDVEVAVPPAEMVRYQPTPARHVFDLIARAGFAEEDVLIDLGSGLGHVTLLVALCTAARTVGIEREASYVKCARRAARALNLTKATFIRRDARAADLSRGTVFYLYTPFTGTIMRTVLDSLRREAAGREVRVCTFGPCTAAFADEPWLEPADALDAGRVAIFRSL